MHLNLCEAEVYYCILLHSYTQWFVGWLVLGKGGFNRNKSTLWPSGLQYITADISLDRTMEALVFLSNCPGDEEMN